MIYQQSEKPLTKDILDSAYDQLDEGEQVIIHKQIKSIDRELKRKKALNAQIAAADSNTEPGKVRGTGFGKTSGMELLAKLGIFLNELEERDPEAFGTLKK